MARQADRSSVNRVWLVIVLVAGALASIGRAQPNVDFSGTWTLDKGKSDQSPTGRTTPTLRIEQTATEFRESTSDGQNTMTTVYRLDGRESVNDQAGATITSIAKWDGPRLIVRSKMRYVLPQGELNWDITDVYTLAGSVLTITNDTVMPGGKRQPPRRLVFTKQ